MAVRSVLCCNNTLAVCFFFGSTVVCAFFHVELIDMDDRARWRLMSSYALPGHTLSIYAPHFILLSHQCFTRQTGLLIYCAHTLYFLLKYIQPRSSCGIYPQSSSHGAPSPAHRRWRIANCLAFSEASFARCWRFPLAPRSCSASRGCRPPPNWCGQGGGRTCFF